MGVFQEKYTKEYYTGIKEDGTILPYGLERRKDDGYQRGDVRELDEYILSRVSFSGQRVLEFGYGRGEAIKYAMERGAASYEALDFSQAAAELAKEFLAEQGIDGVKLHCTDALQFMLNCPKDNMYDIVIMLDVVEHIPRIELEQVMKLLHHHLSEKAVIVIGTPVYREDNDMTVEPLKEANKKNMVDTSNLLPETFGMHNNLYTVPSLQKFMASCGYINITEVHFFEQMQDEMLFEARKAYSSRWKNAFERGLPLLGEYTPDILEYAYVRDFIPTERSFNDGNLQGLSFLMTESYSIALDNGNHDVDFIIHLKKYTADDAIIFDVGGFMGMSSLLMKKHLNCKVFCFEPNPWNFNRIMHNLSLNDKIGGDVGCLSFGLGDKNEDMELLFSSSIDNGYSSTSQLTSGDGTNNSYETLYGLGFATEIVKIYTLDTFVKETGIIPNVIKVDIEGAEALFLSGASETLKTYKPTLYIELHTILVATRCIRTLSDLGYDCSILSQESDGRIMIAATFNDCNGLPDKLIESKWFAYEYESMRIGRAASDRIIAGVFSDLRNTQGQLYLTQGQLKDTQEQLTLIKGQLEDTQEQLTLTQGQLENEQGQLTLIQEQNSELSLKLATVQAESNELTKQLATYQTSNYELLIQLDNFQTHNANLLEQTSSLEKSIKSYEQSTSWRITKPMRIIKRLIRGK